ncbi:MAG: tRNA lysidine(34) synthetase TilS [Rhodospirillaceae bacterium]
MPEDETPLQAAAFSQMMAALGPFEPQPSLAVGLSGGPDSTALLLLACQWAQERGGTVLTLCFDHALRVEAAAELDQAEHTARALGSDTQRLTWSDPPPAGTGGILEAARQARMKALEQACRERGILHLLLGHHRDDQAETIALRQQGGSGPHGLAGMAPILHQPGVRLLRPLLSISKSRLIATLRQREIPWSEDPSNRDLRRARGQLRADPTFLSQTAPLLDQAQRAQNQRTIDEARLDRLVTASVRPDPRLGLAWVDRSGPLAPAHAAVLGRVLGWVGGQRAALDPARIKTALDDADHTVSLGGCLIRPTRDGRAWLVCRECRGLERWDRAKALPAGGSVHWDHRFVIERPADENFQPDTTCWVMALGARRAAQVMACDPDGPLSKVPAIARAALPMVFRCPPAQKFASLARIKGDFSIPSVGEAVYSMDPGQPSLRRQKAEDRPLVDPVRLVIRPSPALSLFASGIRRGG